MLSTPGTPPTKDLEPHEEHYRFHRLGRAAPGYRWWRTVAGTVVVLTGTVLVLASAPSVIAAVAGAIEGARFHSHLADLVLSFAVVALTLPLVLGVTRWIGGRRVGTLISVTGRIRWAWLGFCMLAATAATVIAFTLTIVVAVAAGARTSPPPPAAQPSMSLSAIALAVNSLIVILVLVVLQSAAEEFVSRGWLLQAVGSLDRAPWVAVVTQAVAFTALHGLDLSPWSYLRLFAYSLIIGWLTVATGGIEAAVALHVVSNSFTMVATVPNVIFVGADLRSNASAGDWRPLAGAVIACALYAAVASWWARRRGLDDRAFAPAPLPAATIAPR